MLKYHFNVNEEAERKNSRGIEERDSRGTEEKWKGYPGKTISIPQEGENNPKNRNEMKML